MSLQRFVHQKLIKFSSGGYGPQMLTVSLPPAIAHSNEFAHSRSSKRAMYIYDPVFVYFEFPTVAGTMIEVNSKIQSRKEKERYSFFQVNRF